MISVKEAAEKSAQFARGVLGDEGIQALRLEEVEMTKMPARWFITLSMRREDLLGFSRTEYKTFTVDADTGEVLSMKIRELANAS